MNKPWDNEPTPTTDSKDHRNGIIAYQYARNLERRMRYAELLLAVQYHDNVATASVDIKKLIKDHLEAARQEDGR